MYSSTKITISSSDDTYEAEKEIELQRALHTNQYVWPSKLLAALQWLKWNNPLYKGIEIEEKWDCDAAIDDA